MQERLKEARLQRGLTQEKAGALVGVTENSVYRYEAGTVHPSETALKMLAQVYDKPVEWFYGGEGDEDQGEGLTLAEAEAAYPLTSPDPFLATLTEEEEVALVAELYRKAHPMGKSAVKAMLRADLSYKEQFGDQPGGNGGPAASAAPDLKS